MSAVNNSNARRGTAYMAAAALLACLALNAALVSAADCELLSNCVECGNNTEVRMCLQCRGFDSPAVAAVNVVWRVC